MADPQISVIIPVKNGGGLFEDCLASVMKSKNADFEIVVVDDGSTDNSVETAKKYSCRLVELPASHGPSNARNEGVKTARGDILFFIDADVIIRPNTLRKISSIFEDKDVPAITGVLADEIKYDNFSSQFKNLWMRYTYLRMPDKVPLFYTSVAAIRKEIFEKTGGFDTGYQRPSVEDTDFGQKLEAMGYEVHLRRDIEVEHVNYYSLFKLLKTDFYRSADMLKLTLRNGLKRFMQGNNTSVPSSFIAGALLYFIAVLTVTAGLIFSSSGFFCFVLAVFLIIPIFLLNRPFLNWLKDQKGQLFSMTSLFFLFLDMPVVIMGIIFGAVHYLRGQKY